MAHGLKMILRPHPGASWNLSLERRPRLIGLSILGGLLLSGLAAVSVWAIFIRQTADASDLQLLFPAGMLGLLFLTAGVHRFLVARPRVLLEDDKITLWNRGLNPWTSTVRVLRVNTLLPVQALAEARGLTCVLQPGKGEPIQLLLASDRAPELLDWLAAHEDRLHPSLRAMLPRLRTAFLPKGEWSHAPLDARLDFLYFYSLPFAFRSLVTKKPRPTEEDVERFYRMSRLSADFLYLHELANEVARLRPDFALPREDAFRIACVMRVKNEIEQSLRALEALQTREEIPAGHVERWKRNFKYKDIAAPPYSGIGARLLAGVSHYARVSPDGTLHTHDGEVHVEQFVAVRYAMTWLNTAPLEVIDLAGRTMRINQEEAATCMAIRLVAPHILHIHTHSYMAIRDRLQFRKLKSKLRPASHEV
ncbi:hypothetical protein KKD52_03660 [Myxococcota bacterium]|nr:hypothetical protein [Myxococcota bacterium]MBU1509436.1 hypothetical protein [Myxococcota bacterium]